MAKKKKLSNNLEVRIPQEKTFIKPVKSIRNIDSIILKQSKDKFDKLKAHFHISDSGAITKGINISQAGKYCKDNDTNTIGIILQGTYNIPQQKALMNILYTIFKEVGKDVPVKSYDMFYPGDVNPNLNIRSLVSKYEQNYKK